MVAKPRIAPLSGSYMLAGILGILFSTMVLAKEQAALPWAWVIGIVSVCMFIASLISMTHAPIENELALDEHKSERGMRVRKLSRKEAGIEKVTFRDVWKGFLCACGCKKCCPKQLIAAPKRVQAPKLAQAPKKKK